MPRGQRGGARAGTPGTAYTNRTDLNANRSLPVRAVPGQTYGDRVQQVEAQRMVPMAAAPGTAPPATPASAAPQPSAPPVQPGAFGPIDRQTERPTEPVTAGAPVGAGAGPSAIPAGPSNADNTNLSSMLAQIARASGSQAVQALAQHAMASGQ